MWRDECTRELVAMIHWYIPHSLYISTVAFNSLWNTSVIVLCFLSFIKLPHILLLRICSLNPARYERVWTSVVFEKYKAIYAIVLRKLHNANMLKSVENVIVEICVVLKYRRAVFNALILLRYLFKQSAYAVECDVQRIITAPVTISNKVVHTLQSWFFVHDNFNCINLQKVIFLWQVDTT